MPPLLREWDLLEREVVPPLVEVERTRSPRVWSIGSAKDALAVTVAYRELAGARSPENVKVYVSGEAVDSMDLNFAMRDLKCVPTESRSAFARLDDKWVADSAVAEQVVLSDPAEPVDLVTLRLSDADSSRDSMVDQAVRRLRQGGQFLLISPEATALGSELSGLELGSGDHRLYRKCSPDPVAPCDHRPGGDGQDGDTATLARHLREHQLIRDHVRLARSLARRFAHHGEAADDLNQVAYLALVKAARRFDAERDVRFATYATTSILGELKRHFRDKAWMLRVPRPVQELYLTVKQARDDLTHVLGAVPTHQQIAEHLEVAKNDVVEALEAGENYWPASLDFRTSDDEPVREIAAPDDSLEQTLARIDLERVTPALDDREALILKRLYFDGWTQREVAKEIGVSQMQVSRMLARALAKLRG